MNENPIDQTSRFLNDFFGRLLGWCYNYQDQYWDRRRFGPASKLSLKDKVKHRLKTWAGARGWASRNFQLAPAGQELARILMLQTDYARGYALLADAYSRRVYLDLLSFRALGPRHVRLPINTASYWREYARDDLHVAKRHTGHASMGALDWILNQYDVKGQTGLLHLHMPAGSYQYYFVSRSYDYDREGRSIGVEAGDVVINGGGCWGETDIMFADRCAPDGQVFTFEFVPDNLKILRQNLSANPDLAKRIHLVERAMGEASGQELAFTARGPASRVGGPAPAAGGLQVVTLTVDDLVDQRGLDRVDFIKMDIEGAELAALRGAEKVLRRFRPKLAISAYHKPEDLYALSTYLDSLKLGYRFFMDHFTVHAEETVLFAACDNRKPPEVP